MTVAELLERAHRRGHRLLDEAGMRLWLRELAEAGIAEEVAPDDWRLTEAGRLRFARAGEMEQDR